MKLPEALDASKLTYDDEAQKLIDTAFVLGSDGYDMLTKVIDAALEEINLILAEHGMPYTYEADEHNVYRAVPK